MDPYAGSFFHSDSFNPLSDLLHAPDTVFLDGMTPTSMWKSESDLCSFSSSIFDVKELQATSAQSPHLNGTLMSPLSNGRDPVLSGIMTSPIVTTNPVRKYFKSSTRSDMFVDHHYEPYAPPASAVNALPPKAGSAFEHYRTICSSPISGYSQMDNGIRVNYGINSSFQSVRPSFTTNLRGHDHASLNRSIQDNATVSQASSEGKSNRISFTIKSGRVTAANVTPAGDRNGMHYRRRSSSISSDTPALPSRRQLDFDSNPMTRSSQVSQVLRLTPQITLRTRVPIAGVKNDIIRPKETPSRQSIQGKMLLTTSSSASTAALQPMLNKTDFRGSVAMSRPSNSLLDSGADNKENVCSSVKREQRCPVKGKDDSDMQMVSWLQRKRRASDSSAVAFDSEAAQTNPAYRAFIESCIAEDRLETIDEDDEDEIYKDERTKSYDKYKKFSVSEQELEELLEDYNNFRSKETEISGNQSKHSANPVMPLVGKSCDVSPPPFENFSLSQLEKLEEQMRAHFQTLVQLFALSNEIPQADFITKSTLELLFDLKRNFEKSVRTFGNVSITGQDPALDSLHNDAEHPNAIGEFQFSGSLYPSSKLGSSVIADKFSIFDIPGLQKLDFFQKSYEHLLLNTNQFRLPISADPKLKSPLQLSDSTSYSKNDDLEELPIIPFRFKYMTVQGAGLEMNEQGGPNLTSAAFILPKSIANIKEFFRRDFVECLSIKLSNECHTQRVKFVDAEDKLLIRGLRKYGTSSWSKIRMNYLPGKSEMQIKVRYKNMTSRTAAPNPIKGFYFQQFLPLSEREEELLLKGIQKYKDNFIAISREFLPNRPPSYLKRFWIDKDYKVE